jgi:hypothetical protein
MQRAFTFASFASRLVLVGVCLTVAACATRRVETPRYPWPDKEAALPPIVIRTEPIDSAASDLSSAGAKAMGDTGHNLLMSGLYFFYFPVGPLFTLIAVPMSLIEGHAAYQTETKCLNHLQSVLGDVPAWVRSTFGGTSVAQLVTEGARSQLKDGGPAIIVLQTTRSTEERSAQYVKVGADLGANTLVLADVRVLFGKKAGTACDLKLAAQANVRVQRVGQPESNETRYTVLAEQPQVPLEEWASEPARARKQLDELLATLGRRLVESYADRMGCSERPCEWDATERVQSRRSITSAERCAPTLSSAGPEEANAVSWCLVDPQACPVRCDFTDYESCASVKPDQQHRCVLR